VVRAVPGNSRTTPPPIPLPQGEGEESAWRHLLLALLLVFTLVLPALAVEPSERLPDPAQEARARALGATLRCLVCQNESIDDSHADLAHDIRVLLRERIAAGDTDQQAVQAIVSRYGQFVLLKPPVEPATYVLWFGPVGLLVVGLIGTVVWLRRHPKATPAPAPLSQAEQRRLDSLLQESEP
jgi:cytochrome c-type biogenesis protein CcmH